MRFWSVLLGPLLGLFLQGTLASAMDDKVKKLNAASGNGRNLIQLDTASYGSLVQGQRNYSLLLVLTALDPRFGCKPCGLLEEELKLMATSYAKSTSSPRLYFASLDFNNGKEVFQKLGINSVPIISYHAPNAGPNAKSGKDEPDQYMPDEDGFNADGLARWVSMKSGEKFTINRPIDIQFYAMTSITILTALGLLGLLVMKASVIFQTTKIWSYFSIIFTTIMCSGYMWTTIRHPPYTGRGQKGEVQLFAGGSQYQFGVETSIVATLYLLISLTFAILVCFVPYMSSPSAQRYTVYFFSTAFLTLYSLLLVVFKGKNGGYPFKLFF